MPADDPDFCRVCRCEGTPSQPLFYPCLCTGSIKYVHQDCLVQWLKFSKRQTCELCNHRFTFKPVYAPNTPPVVPMRVLFFGLLTAFRNVIFRCVHLFAVIISWLYVVPLTVCRIFRCFFSGNLISLLSLPLDVLSTEHVIQDCIQGFLIVLIALTALFGCVWLREQLMLVGEPDWLNEVVAAPPAPNTAENDDNNVPAPPQMLPLGAPNNVDNEQPAPEAVAGEGDGQDHQDPGAAADENAGAGLNNNEAEPNHNNQNNGADGGEANPEAEDFDAAGAVPPLTLERIFGLDGTMTFLEHVLWIIVLNILFILLFASLPYFIGRAVISVLGLRTAALTSSIELVLFSFLGYVCMATGLVGLHYLFKGMGLPRSASHYVGLCYIYLKVPIIAFVELGIFTAFCGLWIDTCSLGMFNATVAQRVRAFNYAPMVFGFIHWTMGLMYLFYVSSLFLIIRDVVRPGVLWFLPDFTDPDYRPVQEMISLPVVTYIQRLVVNMSLSGLIIILSILLPTMIAQKLLPGFLPFQMSLAYDSPVDYSVEIIILQIVMPFLLDGQFKVFLSSLLRHWCLGAACLLGLRSYLLGDVAFKPGDEVVLGDGSRVQTEESEGNDAPATPPPPIGGFAPYVRPRLFWPRLIGLLVLVVMSLVGVSFGVLVVPVAMGRLMLSHVGLSQTPHHDALTLLVGVCAIMGWVRTLFCVPMALQTLRNLWIVCVEKAGHLLTWEGWQWLWQWTLSLGQWLRGNSAFAPPRWVRQRGGGPGGAAGHLALMLPPPLLWRRRGAGEREEENGLLGRQQRQGQHQQEIGRVLRELLFTLSVPLRLATLIVVLLVILPAGLGLLLNLVVFVPVWIAPQKTLALGFAECWIFGVLHLKLWTLIVLLGPRGGGGGGLRGVRAGLEAVYAEVAGSWPAVHVFRVLRLSMPLLASLGLALSAPFLLAHYVAPLLLPLVLPTSDEVPPEIVFRYIYPFLFGLLMLLEMVRWQVRQCFKLYEQIKDAEYLIGRRLVNYGDPAQPPSSSSAVAEMATQTDLDGVGNELVAVET